MLDKEVALVSIVFLFVIIGAYLFIFQPAQVISNLGMVNCSLHPEQSEIFLPKPNMSDISLDEAIKERRSERSFSEDFLTLSEISSLLWAGQGITDEQSGARAAPSAGALYPIELYLVPNRVKGAECGIYHYIPDGHKLVLVKEGSFGSDLEKASFAQAYVGDAAAVIVMTSVPARTAVKYGDEGAERFINIEAGHISQNILLEAAALGLGAAPIGSFSQDYVDSIIGVDGNKEKSVYIAIVGKKK